VGGGGGEAYTTTRPSFFTKALGVLKKSNRRSRVSFLGESGHGEGEGDQGAVRGKSPSAHGPSFPSGWVVVTGMGVKVNCNALGHFQDCTGGMNRAGEWRGRGTGRGRGGGEKRTWTAVLKAAKQRKG